MKIIAFGDIHMATAQARKIPGIKEADLVLLNGDLTNYGGAKETRSVLDDIMNINPNVLAQFGNLDGRDVNEYLEKLEINLHGQARLVQGEVCLIGVGGSNFTPFRTPSEFSEKEILHLADRAFRQGLEYISLAQPLHNRKIPMILVSHVPPFNTEVDTLYNGRHVGSKAIRTVIEQYQPDLCITGHIHEAKGKDMILNTPIYNHGMLRQGGWVTIDIIQSQIEITLQ
jgi:Icc-related predicted phosphoesterase